MELVLKSQGCADLGICYPPQTWTEPVRWVAANTGQANKPDKLIFGSPFGNAPDDFLPVAEASKPSITPLDGNEIEL